MQLIGRDAPLGVLRAALTPRQRRGARARRAGDRQDQPRRRARPRGRRTGAHRAGGTHRSRRRRSPALAVAAGAVRPPRTRRARGARRAAAHDGRPRRGRPGGPRRAAAGVRGGARPAVRGPHGGRPGGPALGRRAEPGASSGWPRTAPGCSWSPPTATPRRARRSARRSPTCGAAAAPRSSRCARGTTPTSPRCCPPRCTRPGRRCCAARPRACRCWSPPCWRTSSTPTGRRTPRPRTGRGRSTRPSGSSTSPPNGWPGWIRPRGRPSRSRPSRARAAVPRTSPGSARRAARRRSRRWRRAWRPGCWCRPLRSCTATTSAHALLRDSVYAQVPAVRRVPWHAALADAIEAGELPGEPVTHRLRAAVDPASCAAAVAACRAAAARAEGVLAFDRVVELLDAARHLPGVDRTTRVDLELSAAAADFAAGRAETAVRRCRAVAAEGATAAQLVQAALTVRGLGGPLNAELLLLCDAALTALPEHDLAGRARVLAQRALAEWESAGWASVDAPSAEALRLAERSGSPVALADALRARQHAVSDVEGVTERLELAQRMITLARTGGPADAELWGRLWRIDAALQLGRIDVVDDELVQLAVLAERLGWPIAWWHQHRMTGARLLLAGRFADAEAAADRADAEARRTEDITALNIGGALRGEILRLTGRYGEAVERLRAAREGVRLRGVPIFLATAGLIFAEAGETDEARRMLDELRALLPRQPRDGRWIATVAGAGLLATLLVDEPTVVWCLDQLTPVRRLLPRGRVGLGALRRVGQPRDGLPRGGAGPHRRGPPPAHRGDRHGRAHRRPPLPGAVRGRAGRGARRRGRADGGRGARAAGRRHRPPHRDAARAGGRRGRAGAAARRARHRPPADHAGARGAGAAGRGPDQPADRRRARAVGAHRRDPRRPRAGQARRGQPRRGRRLGHPQRRVLISVTASPHFHDTASREFHHGLDRILSGWAATVRVMGYRELRAPAALAGLVECGWVDTATADGAQQVLPDGCMDLVWTGAELLVAGPDTVAHHGRRRRGVTVAGLRFVPGALPSLLGVPAAPLHNRRVAARRAGARARPGRAGPARGGRGSAWPCSPRSPPGCPARRPTVRWPRCAARSPRWARGRPRGGSMPGRSPPSPTRSAAPPRSVHRRCQAAFGYGPAVLRRVLRFRRAAALLRAGVSPAEVAAAAGLRRPAAPVPGDAGVGRGVARSAGQRGEQVHAVAVRVEHHGVALAPEPVERRELALVPGRHQVGVQRVQARGVGQGEREVRPPAAHRRPVRVEGADHVLGVEHQPQTTGQPDLDVPLPVGRRGHVQPHLPVEGQGLGHVRHHDPDRVHPRFSAHDRKARRGRRAPVVNGSDTRSAPARPAAAGPSGSRRAGAPASHARRRSAATRRQRVAVRASTMPTTTANAKISRIPATAMYVTAELSSLPHRTTPGRTRAVAARFPACGVS